MQRQKQKQHTDSLMRSVQQFTKRSTFSPDSSCFPPGSCTPSQSRTSWTAAQGLCGNGGDDHDQENDDDDRKSEELIPKMVRWPTHIDHYLCKKLHNGLGVRSHAVTNLNGDLCRTYCRIIDRMNGKITYTENVTPNFVRCGPYQARCVDGACVGLNFPTPGSAPPPPPAEEAIPELTAESSASNNSGNETAIESAEVSAGGQSGEAISTDDNSSVGSFASTSTTTSLPTLFSEKGGSDQQRQQHYQTLNDRNERRVTRQATQIVKT